MRSTLTSLALAALLASPALALEVPTDLTPIGAVQSWEKDAAGATLHCKDGSTVRLQVLATDLVRVRVAFGKAIPAADHSWAVDKTKWNQTAFQSQEDASSLTLSTSELKVIVQKQPLQIRFADAQGNVIQSDAQPMSYDAKGTHSKELFDPAAGPLVAMSKHMGAEEHFYGMGEKASLLDKRRGYFQMWNTDFSKYPPDQDPIYQDIPFYIGLNHGKAYGLFWDNSFKTHWDFGHTGEEHVNMAAEGGEINYYFFQGPQMSKVVNRYTELTGRMPMPPRWALGHQACRYSYYPDSLVERIVKTYREHDLPLDAIHIDIHFMQDYRVFTWSLSRFADPSALIKRLGDLGVKVITIVDPGVKYQPAGGSAPAQEKPELKDQSGHYYVYDEGTAKGYFVKRHDGTQMITKVWPGDSVLVDYTREDARRWWGDLHRAYTDHGVAGIWNDMNEPADFVDQTGGNMRDSVHQDNGENSGHAKNRNVFGFLEGRATFEGLRRLRPNERPFIVTRAGYAGQQRYTAMWIGDTPSTWAALALSVPMYTNLGLSGEPFVGGDIGGYAGHTDGEFLVRSYQLGFLVPFCRNHKEVGGYDQEPWRFGPYYENIIRDYLKLRYQLLPYIYTGMEEAHRTGLPLLRAVLLHDQTDPQLCTLDDQLMVGADLLLAPVVRAAQETRRLYLPKGDWYDFWTGEKLAGKQFVVRPSPLERAPMFVRAGAIVPMGPRATQTDGTEQGVLTLHVFPDAQGNASGDLYEDDGHSENYLQGQSSRRHFTVSGGVLHISARVGSYKPKSRPYEVVWHTAHGPAVSLPESTPGRGAHLSWQDDGSERSFPLSGKSLP